MMRKALLISFLLMMTFVLNAQDNKKNSISLSTGPVLSNKMESFSPVIDLTYRRNLTDKFGLDVGCKFKGCSCDMSFVKTGFKNPFPTCDGKPYQTIKMNNYFLSDLKLGVAFKF